MERQPLAHVVLKAFREMPPPASHFCLGPTDAELSLPEAWKNICHLARHLLRLLRMACHSIPSLLSVFQKSAKISLPLIFLLYFFICNSYTHLTFWTGNLILLFWKESGFKKTGDCNPVICVWIRFKMDFPDSSAGKESTWSAGDPGWFLGLENLLGKG